jgi:hypothetical protein
VYISITFPKAGICFELWFGWERVAKFAETTAWNYYAKNLFAKILSDFHTKFEIPLIMKVVFLEKLNNFHIGIFLSCEEKIGGIAETLKVFKGL